MMRATSGDHLQVWYAGQVILKRIRTSSFHHHSRHIFHLVAAICRPFPCFSWVSLLKAISVGREAGIDNMLAPV